MGRPPTSHDVAALAGVSQSTVSNVLTGRSGIAEATRQRVLEAALALNYRPNLAARSMRTRRTGRLAILLTNVAWKDPTRLLVGATRAAHEAGYAIEILTAPETAVRHDGLVQDIVDSGQFEGVLSVAPLRSNVSVNEDQTIVLALAEFDEDMKVTGELADAAPVVTFVEELAALGHRRFLHIAGALDFASARARRDAYLATIKRLGLHSIGVVEGDWTGGPGLEAIRALPNDAPPLAVIAANDLTATGVIRGALERAWSIPGDIEVTGWDNYASSEFQVPSITTVVVDYEKLGYRSIQRLVAVLRGDSEPVITGGLQRIIWRESTSRLASSSDSSSAPSDCVTRSRPDASRPIQSATLAQSRRP